MANRASRSISMSPAALTQWQAVLREKRIGTVAQLLSLIIERAPTEEKDAKNVKYTKDKKVKTKTTIDGEPTARKAMNGERIDKTSWILIFDYLDLYLGDFFTDAEWFGRDPWKMLLDLAEDASDRFGIVHKGNLQTSGLCDGLVGLRDEEEFLSTVSSGSKVLIKISEKLAGQLILVEQDSKGQVELLAPSCLMFDSELKNQIQRLPQYPPSKFPCLIPTTIGTSYLWAGIFAELPDFEWLGNATQGVLKLQMEQLNDLLEYAQQERSKATTQILKLSYVVTAT